MESFSFVGPDAERTLRNYNANVAFFSCRGLSENGLASDNTIRENNIRKIMIQKSQRNYLLCDSSKLGHTYLNTLCHVNNIDKVICDVPLPEFDKPSP